MRRKEALAAIGSALLLPSCGGGNSHAVKIGSKNFTENVTIAEIYAGALENSGLTVARTMNLGSTQIAQAALLRGDIDLYPEYTGTGLIDVLHHAPMHDSQAMLRYVREEYERRFHLTWLKPSPMNNSQGLAVTKKTADRYGLRTLSQCAKRAPQLRLAAVPEFVSRADALPGLQRYYGGFHFAQVRTFTIGLQYQALVRGDADVSTAFTTDSQIVTDDLVVLQDDKHFWPPYNVAPVVRDDALRAHPKIKAVLSGVSPLLTDEAVRQLNAGVNVKHMDPSDAAAAFLKAHSF